MIACFTFFMDVTLLPPRVRCEGNVETRMVNQMNLISDFLSTLGWPSMSESSESCTGHPGESMEIDLRG
jgi:hypothetical protein